jgi:hypothetical protein
MSQASADFSAPRRLPVVLALVTALAVLLQPLLATSADAAAKKAPVPAAKALPAQIEPLPNYEGPVTCDPVAKAGPKKLVALLQKTYGSTAFGITRACSGVPTSEHQEGRAVDWMQGSGTTKADADAFLKWLLATDAHHNTVAMARRMGIMYVVWQNRMFRVYQPDRGWQPYQNCGTAAMKGAANDTYCHRNHVHFSFTWDGAGARTSYWSGRAITVPDCDRPWQQPARTSPTRTRLDYVALPSTPLLDTTTGLGTPSGKPCRLAEQNGYSGEGRRLDVVVAGVAGVPVNARAVVLQVRTGSPNATGALRVQPAGASTWAVDVATPSAGVSSADLVTVPVGAGGAVSMTLTTGQAYVAADVVGYFVAAGDPAGTELHAVAPHVALTTSALASMSTVGLTRADLGGVPNSASAVSVAVTVSAGTLGGGVRVFGADDPAPPVRAAAPTTGAGRTATTPTVVRLGRGTGSTPVVFVRNDTGSREVQVVVTGWYAPTSVAGGAVYQTLPPTVLVNSPAKVGLASPLEAGVARSVLLTGHGVPAHAVAVVAQVRLTSDARTHVAVWASGPRPAGGVLADESRRTTTTALCTGLNSTGHALLASDAGATNVRLVAVGAWVTPS